MAMPRCPHWLKVGILVFNGGGIIVGGGSVVGTSVGGGYVGGGSVGGAGSILRAIVHALQFLGDNPMYAWSAVPVAPAI